MSTRFPRGQFDLIYADPAWQYENKAASAGQWGGAAAHYSTMTIEQLCALPVAQLAAPNCLLAMWWVPVMPAEALRVVDAWGFTLKNFMGFTWHKRTKHGKSHFGMGTLTRGNPECCLFAVRGKPLRVSASVRSFLDEPIGRHSAKPAEARRRLEQLLGDVRRIELFARDRHRGWSAWGNEI